MVMAETVRQLQINAAVVAGVGSGLTDTTSILLLELKGGLIAGLGVWCQD